MYLEPQLERKKAGKAAAAAAADPLSDSAAAIADPLSAAWSDPLSSARMHTILPRANPSDAAAPLASLATPPPFLVRDRHWLSLTCQSPISADVCAENTCSKPFEFMDSKVVSRPNTLP
jgi:hypothetical protein